MKRALIVYESVYGNTERVAALIAEEIRSSGEVQCDVRRTGEIHTDELASYDAIIFGCPNHNQEPARNLLKFIDRVAAVEFDEKIGAAFDTYTGGNKRIAVSKLEKIISQKVPCIKIAVDGLSMKVEGRKGPLVESDLELAREFGRAIVGALR